MSTKTDTSIAVWDLPVRVFHWLLATSFAGAFLTAESEHWRSVHVMLGYTVFGLILFRLVWGFVGSRHARFASFMTGPVAVGRYMRSLFTGHPEHHVGHNPAGALAILALLALGLVTGISGWAVYNDIGGEWVEELHEGAAWLMLAVVGAHIAGVLVSSVLHRENLVAAMFSGRKTGNPSEAIGSRHRVVGVLVLAAVVLTWIVWTADRGAPAGPADEIAGLTMPGHGHGRDDDDDD